MEMKVALLRAIREDARRRWAEQWKEALHLVGAGTLLDERALTIGFARRRRASSRSEEHTSELQSHHDLVCRLLLEKKKNTKKKQPLKKKKRNNTNPILRTEM